jgi:hypothetical protein
MVAVGLPHDTSVVAGSAPLDLALRRKNIVGSVTGTLKDVEEALDFTARGLVHPILTKGTLHDVDKFCKLMIEGEYTSNIMVQDRLLIKYQVNCQVGLLLRLQVDVKSSKAHFARMSHDNAEEIDPEHRDVNTLSPQIAKVLFLNHLDLHQGTSKSRGSIRFRETNASETWRSRAEPSVAEP